jgi:hypothetical protein
MIADSLKRQSAQIFTNIEYLFDDIDDALMGKTIGGFPFWKQVYHMLHSMDKNFMDPAGFTEPDIHSKNLDIIFMDTGRTLSRQALLEYYGKVKSKTMNYLDSLDDAALEETVSFRDLRLTRMELALAQFRHIFYHIGYLHCCIRTEKGRTPEYVGIYKAIPEK